MLPARRSFPQTAGQWYGCGHPMLMVVGLVLLILFVNQVRVETPEDASLSLCHVERAAQGH